MIYYPALSAVQLAPAITGSKSLNNFLRAVNYDYASITPDAAKDTITKYNQTFNDISSTLYKTLICTVRNPYARFAARWQRNTLQRQSQSLTPFTFEEWITDYNNNHWVAPLLTEGLWEHRITSNANFQFGQITAEFTACGIDPSSITYIHLENFQNDVKTIPHVDVTKAAQASAFNDFIVTDCWSGADYPNWKSVYTTDLANKVYTAFSGDFAAFGYDQNSWQS